MKYYDLGNIKASVEKTAERSETSSKNVSSMSVRYVVTIKDDEENITDKHVFRSEAEAPKEILSYAEINKDSFYMCDEDEAEEEPQCKYMYGENPFYEGY